MTIDFTRAFDSAWERMMVILFRPFDLGKWFVIGFSAFLAGLLQGGNGVNFSGNGFNNNNGFNKSTGDRAANFDLHILHSDVSNAFAGMQLGLIICVAAVLFAFILVFAALIYWLGARGQFLFIDNIVRNRGAISWPWTTYARQANSLFLFYLLFIGLSLVIFVPILAVVVIMCVPLFMQHRWPGSGEILGFVFLFLLYLILGTIVTVILFVFREFGVPLMFRNGLMARPAFWEAMNLVKLHPGSIALFVLLRMAIFMGVVVISVIVCCVTCCIGLLPYIGTVFLLPMLVFIRCFTLDCLAQFGPQYDVWTVDVAPIAATPSVTPPFSPQPPLG